MIHEGDPIALRRDARVIQVACGFIEHLADGIFEASQVIVRHDENYVAPSAGQIPSQVIDPGG